MENKFLSKKIKELRISKNLSQEKLAELSELSLRTIQRIEKGEVNPTSDSITRLSVALNCEITKVTDEHSKENTKLLRVVYLSSLSYIIFPLLGFLVPTVTWIWKKEELKENKSLIKSLLYFQITWCILLVIFPIISFIVLNTIIMIIQPIVGPLVTSTIEHLSLSMEYHVVVWIFLYIFNLYFILKNAWRLDQKTKVDFFQKMLIRN